MTREEAIDILENEKMCVNNETCQREECATCSLVMDKDKILTALDMALSALRPVSRERVEKVWRGCPECKPRCGLCVYMGAWDRHGKPYVCEKCVDYSNFESDQRFCEVCGCPMTDEAVQMVMERLEELRDEKG